MSQRSSGRGREFSHLREVPARSGRFFLVFKGPTTDAKRGSRMTAKKPSRPPEDEREARDPKRDQKPDGERDPR